MICMKCGAANAETTSACRRCGAVLQIPAREHLAAHSSAQPSLPDPRGEPPPGERAAGGPPAFFAPVAHSPFSDEPLPQPSGALPALIQPIGDILVFAPTAELPVPGGPGQANPAPSEQTTVTDAHAAALSSFSRDLADYPTETGVRVAGMSAAANPAPGRMPPPPSVHPAQQAAGVFAGPAAPDALLAAWSENAARLSGEEREYDAAYVQRSPASQPLGNVYPGPPVPRSQPLGNVYPGLPEQVSSSLRPMRSNAEPLSGSGVNTLVRPLPLRAWLPGLAAGVLLLLALVFLNPDWATGATVSGLVAVIFALLLLIAAGVRVALGLLARTNPRRRSQVISISVLVLCLFCFAGLGLNQQTGLHTLQARFLENQQSWQAAVSEYQAAGETAPASDNLARTYVEWGESLSRQRQYSDAVNRFATVLSQYTQATDQVHRAKSDLVAAYLAWAADAVGRQDYNGAVAHYDALLASGDCDPACRSLAQTKDATTYDQLAEQRLTAQQYGPAVAAFKALTTRFPLSPEAGLVHADYARALWGLGQQQLATTCTDAIAPYQQLALQFADTAEGRQAAVALQQAVQVKGRFTRHVPAAPGTPTVFLVQGLVVGIHQYQFPPLLRTAPTTHIQADGTFTFPSVPPGIYELVWSSDGTLHFYYAFSGTQVLYTAHIGPLCAYDFGNVDQVIPSGNG
jgi:tetratricopeptide (TPR) repeat protein